MSICTKNQPRAPRSTSSTDGTNQSDQSNSSSAPASLAVNYVDTKTPVLLQTAKARIYNLEDPQRAQDVRILLDNGSQQSYVTEEIQHTLSLTTESVETMVIKTFGSNQEKRRSCGVVHLGMSLKGGGHLNLSFFTVPMICEPLSTQPIARARRSHQHLAGLDLADFSHGNEELHIDILIGSDHYWKLATGEVRQGSSRLTAVQTRLGWVLSGPVDDTERQDAVNLVSTHILRTDTQPLHQKCDLDEGLRKFWDLDTLGIKEEGSVYEEFERNVTSRDGMYEVCLPWKEPHPVLLDNLEQSRKRLTGLLKRLKHSPQILQQYDAVIKDQLEKGIVEIVQDPEVVDGHEVHYIPHHAVIREDKTTTKL